MFFLSLLMKEFVVPHLFVPGDHINVFVNALYYQCASAQHDLAPLHLKILFYCQSDVNFYLFIYFMNVTNRYIVSVVREFEHSVCVPKLTSTIGNLLSRI